MVESSFLADGLDLSAEAPLSLAGQTIGAYILERPLGMGGVAPCGWGVAATAGSTRTLP
jgi:hypothetical protein